MCERERELYRPWAVEAMVVKTPLIRDRIMAFPRSTTVKLSSLVLLLSLVVREVTSTFEAEEKALVEKARGFFDPSFSHKRGSRAG